MAEAGQADVYPEASSPAEPVTDTGLSLPLGRKRIASAVSMTVYVCGGFRRSR
jgi:hypothetical protein